MARLTVLSLMSVLNSSPGVAGFGSSAAFFGVGNAQCSQQRILNFDESHYNIIRPTALNISPRLAQMIDDQYYYQNHKMELDQKFHQQNDKYCESQTLPDKFEFNEDLLCTTQKMRDYRLARTDPARYCADRCLATGFCDAYEEFFEFSAEEVKEFCTECVLSDDEEPCDVPVFKSIDELTLVPLKPTVDTYSSLFWAP